MEAFPILYMWSFLRFSFCVCVSETPLASVQQQHNDRKGIKECIYNHISNGYSFPSYVIRNSHYFLKTRSLGKIGENQKQGNASLPSHVKSNSVLKMYKNTESRDLDEPLQFSLTINLLMILGLNLNFSSWMLSSSESPKRPKNSFSVG